MAKSKKETGPALPETLVLLDAHAIIHRAYHALPEFLSSSGEPTGALYGLATMLMKIITELKPDYLAACYDLPGKTFRHEAYENYKAGRVKADEALVLQLKNSRQIFEAFNIPIYDCPGFEADDILGTAVEQLKVTNYELRIIIASGDMDTMQLVSGQRVQVYTLRKGIADTILYDEEKVKERYGFPPALLPDYKGLRGDPSDNIIGVKGIGDKTATILIQKFGTIEEIYKQLRIKNYELRFKKLGISDRIIKILKENEEEALFSKTLAQIRTDAPIKFKLPVKTFWASADIKKTEEVFAHFEFRSLVSRLKTFFGSGQTSPPAPLLTGEGEPEFIEGSGEVKEPENVNSEEFRETSIALWLINSDLVEPKLEDMLSFARTNSFGAAREFIFQTLKERKLDKVFTEIEKPLIPIVAAMQNWGILIDKKYFEKLSREYHRELDTLTRNIYRLAGTEFNINSPKQLSEVLFGKLGLVSGKKKNERGAFSTKAAILEELEETNPIVKEILNYRELSKLVSTYVDVMPKMTGSDGRLHARFIQNGSTTGRFSSQDPNLQNLPIKSELGRRIREGFVAEQGCKLCAFDYSQIELRVAAILSGDPKLVQIFREKKDVHASVAAFVFGVPQDKVDAEMRRKAKVINFGILYGMGVSALKKNLGGPPGTGRAGTRPEAQKFYDNYFEQFAGLKKYLADVKDFAAAHHYAETLFGRRRNFPNINSRIPFLRAMAERTAINAPIQGSSADIIKLAIRFAEEDLAKAGLKDDAHLVLQIHDELVYEIKNQAVARAQVIIKNAMEGALARARPSAGADVPLAEVWLRREFR